MAQQTADPKLIESMAMRYRHDFFLLEENEKESIRITMRQLWEEVVGLGFYKFNPVTKNEDGTIVEFLLGSRSYEGVWFGEEHPRLDGRFWWRPILKSYIESIKTKAK